MTTSRLSTPQQRFLDACRCRPVDHPPIWLMRQAGRVLPEYRKLKEKHSFLELVQTPELAAEVTLQPIRRFGFDAAILFSDILVAAEGLGQPYHFHDKGGVHMEWSIDSQADVARLQVEAVRERLHYVAKAIPLIKKELGEKTALIGFAGSPWTLANFMLSGGSTKEFTRAKQLFYGSPGLFTELFEKLTQAVIELLRMQIEAGVDAVQIFDSLGGLLAPHSFEAASGRWIQSIISSLGAKVPVILFSKGTNGCWETLGRMGAQVVGVDWTVSLAEVRQHISEGIALQGNLDPFVLQTTPEIVAAETKVVLRAMAGRNGHVFNLGHGVPPAAKLENLESLIHTVRTYS